MANTNVSLVKVSETVLSSNEQLVKFRDELSQVANLVFPENYNFGMSPTHKVTASIVTINPSDPRDVYKTDSGTYAIHLAALNRIARAANLIFTDSRILERQVDEKGQVVMISHQVKWRISSIDGSLKEGTTTGKYDYYRDLANGKSAAQVNSRRKHAEANAESNAKYRAINEAIAEIPRSFQYDELKKPFIVPCIIEDKNELLKDLPPETQAEIKKLRAAQAFGLMDQMYPQSANKALPEANPKVENIPASAPISGNIQDAQVISDSAEPTTAEKNHIIAEEFRDAPQSERTSKILNICRLKGIKNPSSAPVSAAQIEKKSVDEQIIYLEKILNIPDVEEDLPL
ncbi:MAG: hypothetical protein ACM3Q2_10540 [Syntrophothermus sp.]